MRAPHHRRVMRVMRRAVALEVLVLLEALILELVDLVFSCQQHSKIQYPQ